MTLDELLALVGRLDDSPGFDTPRERYRRFLVERVTTVPAARALIEDCQRAVGEQRHRALQDLIILLGRFLGFEVSFVPYGDNKPGGISPWTSPGLLEVVLELRTEQTPDSALDGLKRAVADVEGAGGTIPRIGLCVVARQYVARGKLGRAARDHGPHVHVVSARALVSLSERVADERTSHSEAVKILRSDVLLDATIDRLPGSSPVDPSSGTPFDAEGSDSEPRRLLAGRASAYWIATITEDDGAAPEQVFSSVIASRGLLGICDGGDAGHVGSPGDWVCFFLPRKGIVGHAQLASIIENAGNVLRDASRFSRVFRLAHVRSYEQPVAQALRREWPFSVRASATMHGPRLMPIARDDFLSFTAHGEGGPGAGGLTLLRTPRWRSVGE